MTYLTIMYGSTLNTEPEQLLHVAVGVVRNSNGEILIAKRDEKLHQGGLWEFPGGKVEQSESVESALKRELFEELGIVVNRLSPLIKITHAYPDRRVLLDVWRVESFSGEAYGKEQQPILWVTPEALKNYNFPAANRAIRLAVELPPLYGILDVASNECQAGTLRKLVTILESGCKLVQLRGKMLERAAFEELAFLVKDHCDRYEAKLLLNASPSLVDAVGSAGVHLSSSRLNGLSSRPLSEQFLVSASCHNQEELEQACRIGVDFVVLSPVSKTLSHPEAVPMGWKLFESLVEGCSVPVYGLGGMSLLDVQAARNIGAQGVAGISLFDDKAG